MTSLATRLALGLIICFSCLSLSSSDVNADAVVSNCWMGEGSSEVFRQNDDGTYTVIIWVVITDVANQEQAESFVSSQYASNAATPNVYVYSSGQKVAPSYNSIIFNSTGTTSNGKTYWQFEVKYTWSAGTLPEGTVTNIEDQNYSLFLLNGTNPTGQRCARSSGSLDPQQVDLPPSVDISGPQQQQQQALDNYLNATRPKCRITDVKVKGSTTFGTAYIVVTQTIAADAGGGAAAFYPLMSLEIEGTTVHAKSATDKGRVEVSTTSAAPPATITYRFPVSVGTDFSQVHVRATDVYNSTNHSYPTCLGSSTAQVKVPVSQVASSIETTNLEEERQDNMSPECRYLNSRRSTQRYDNETATLPAYNYQGQNKVWPACKDSTSVTGAGVMYFQYSDDGLRVYADYRYNSDSGQLSIGQVHYDCPNGKVRMIIFNECSNLQDFSNSIYAWATYIAIFIAIVAYIRGGFMYVTSRGDPSKTAEAKGVLTTAGIGLVLIVVALVIVQILGSSLSSTGWGIDLDVFIQ